MSGKKEVLKLKKSWWFWAIVLVVALVVLSTVVALLTAKANPVVVKVGDYNISQSEMNDFKYDAQQYSKSISDADAKETLISYYKTKKAVSENNIAISDGLLSSLKRDTNLNYLKDKNTKNSYVDKRAYIDAVNRYVERSSIGGYDVVVYSAPRNVRFGIVDDKLHAYLADLQQKIAKGELNSETAAEKITKDSMFDTISIYSGFLDASGGWVKGDGTRDMRSVGMEAEELMKYVKANIGKTGQVVDSKGSYYLFATIYSEQKTQANLSAAYKKSINNIKVVEYVK